MNPDCRPILILLPQVLLGEAGTEEVERVEGHLLACPTCREESDRISSLLGALATLEVPDPGEVYWQSLVTRLRARIGAEETRGGFLPAWQRWAVAASAAIILLAAGAVTRFGPPAEGSSRAALRYLAARTDPGTLRQALDEVLPGPEFSPPVRTGGESPHLPGPAELQRALDSVLPPEDGDLYGAANDLSPVARRWLILALVPDRV